VVMPRRPGSRWTAAPWPCCSPPTDWITCSARSILRWRAASTWSRIATCCPRWPTRPRRPTAPGWRTWPGV
jgi:hypothetical protein